MQDFCKRIWSYISHADTVYSLVSGANLVLAGVSAGLASLIGYLSELGPLAFIISGLFVFALVLIILSLYDCRIRKRSDAMKGPSRVNTKLLGAAFVGILLATAIFQILWDQEFSAPEREITQESGADTSPHILSQNTSGPSVEEKLLSWLRELGIDPVPIDPPFYARTRFQYHIGLPSGRAHLYALVGDSINQVTSETEVRVSDSCWDSVHATNNNSSVVAIERDVAATGSSVHLNIRDNQKRLQIVKKFTVDESTDAGQLSLELERIAQAQRISIDSNRRACKGY